MPLPTTPILCDGDRACEAPLTFVCACGRCEREPDDDERFHTCATHGDAADAKHQRIRGRAAQWTGYAARP